MSLYTSCAGRLIRPAIVSFALTMAGMVSATPLQPSGCTDISQIPAIFDIQYGAAIQSLFMQFSSNPQVGCADCHTSMDGAMTPAGFLNLDSTDPAGQSPYANIVGVPSVQVPELDYVNPGHPELSYLFIKVNCDMPIDPDHSRMPLGYTDVFTPEQQALIYDWILLGAPIDPTTGIFRNNFEYRGFNQ